MQQSFDYHSIIPVSHVLQITPSNAISTKETSTDYIFPKPKQYEHGIESRENVESELTSLTQCDIPRTIIRRSCFHLAVISHHPKILFYARK